VSKLFRIAAFSALLAHALPALAQGGDSAAAEKLFRDGATALKRGDVDRACTMLAQSNTIDPAIGTLGLLALCHERQGRTATAAREYRTVASLARSANQPERAQIAGARADDLAPHVSHLELALPDHPSNLVVEVGGQLVPVADLKAPLALDPGAVVVRISADGFESRTEMAVIAADGSTTELLVPELKRVAVPPADIVLAEPEPARHPVAAVPPSPRPERAQGSPATWVAAGVGTAGLVFGGVFGVLALSSNSRASSHCTGNDCDETGVALRASALHEATASTIAFAAGAAAIGASLVLYVTTDHEAPSVAADLRATPNGGLLSLHGCF
jgi:hypothetical protein